MSSSFWCCCPILSINPGLTQQEVRDILENTATDMGVNGFDNNFGNGRVNAFAAVQAALPQPEILGISSICNSANETFTLLNNTELVTWETSSNLTTISSNNTSITVCAINSSVSGWGYVRATTSAVTVQKDVWVGTPKAVLVSGEPQYGGSYVTGQNIYLNFEDEAQQVWPYINDSNFQFRKATSYNYDYHLVTKSGQTIVLQIDSSNYCAIDIEVRFKNECGWGPWKYYEWFLDLGGGGYYYSVYNNTSSNELNVEIFESDDSKDIQSSDFQRGLSNTLKDEYDIIIADLYGIIKYKGSKKKDKVLKINTASWPKSIYFINMTNSKGKTVNKGFAIE
ncbi:hypothetical protein KFZ70_02925 [Tamlana fucoidanivorans]|uniref:T9SS type A sorting domain-containing protein n=1 Tax=Allotamlana fucoidanivorans TaxID=2583814 RepID=A0A5C4SGQ1_9FLAO|nr:hypothetical protein [Tamlana fucoidanivorans]TNJ41933.1 hypothetical protein FGF67_15355 [Tamlana fucoidanivorans]